jgi:peroxiredoxin
MLIKIKIKILSITLFLSASLGQDLGVGDTIPAGYGLPVCANEVEQILLTNDSLFLDAYAGDHVIWLMMFSSWCPFCQDEAPFTQDMYDALQDSGLIIIGAGWDWGQPFSCEEWADGYGLTYPLLDDEGPTQDGGDEYFFNTLADGGVPWNVIIDHEMVIRYSVGGYNPEDVQAAVLEAISDCGGACTGCSEIMGELDNTFTMDGQPIINVMDIIKLADILSFGNDIDNCLLIKADLSGDGLVDIIDLYALASMVSEGQFDN